MRYYTGNQTTSCSMRMTICCSRIITSLASVAQSLYVFSVIVCCPDPIFLVLFMKNAPFVFLQGNKFKRLKKAGRESEMDEHSGFSDGDGTGKKRSGKERVEYSLFGDHQGTRTRI